MTLLVPPMTAPPRVAARPTRPIVRVPAERYTPPAALSRTLRRSEIAVFAALLSEVRAISDEHVGLDHHATLELRNGDPEIVGLIARGTPWLERYVLRQVRGADGYERFSIIQAELGRWLGELEPLGVNALVLGPWTRFLAWFAMDRTWGRRVAVRGGWDGAAIEYGDADPAVRAYCTDWIARAGWDTAGHLALAAGASGDRPAACHEAVPRLQALANAIRHMRPILAETALHEAPQELAPDRWGAWVWSHGHLLGTLAVCRSRTELERALAGEGPRIDLGVRPDGVLVNALLPWETCESCGAWPFNRQVLERVHAQLRARFDAIDLARLAADGASVGAAVPAAAPHAWARVAASCLRLAGADRPGASLRDVPAERVRDVLARLGVPPDGRFASAGTEGLRWAEVVRALRRLGVSVEDWLAAAADAAAELDQGRLDSKTQ